MPATVMFTPCPRPGCDGILVEIDGGLRRCSCGLVAEGPTNG